MKKTAWTNRAPTTVTLAVAIAVSGCQGMGPMGSFLSQPLTPAEAQLRQDEKRFNNTVISGVLIGAAGGAVAGGFFSFLTGGNKKNVRNAALGGAVVGAAALGIDGYLTAKKEQAGKQNIRAAQAAAADVQKDNANLQNVVDTSERVLAEGKSRMSALKRDVASRKISADQAREQRAREEKNIASMIKSLEQARKTRQQYAEASNELKQTKENTRDMDREIAQMDQKIGQLENTVNAYREALEVSRA